MQASGIGIGRDASYSSTMVLGRRSLKNRAKNALRADIAVREEEDRRQRLATALQKDAERREVMDRLMKSDSGAGTMSFLLKKPDML